MFLTEFLKTCTCTCMCRLWICCHFHSSWDVRQGFVVSISIASQWRIRREAFSRGRGNSEMPWKVQQTSETDDGSYTFYRRMTMILLHVVVFIECKLGLVCLSTCICTCTCTCTSPLFPCTTQLDLVCIFSSMSCRGSYDSNWAQSRCSWAKESHEVWWHRKGRWIT